MKKMAEDPMRLVPAWSLMTRQSEVDSPQHHVFILLPLVPWRQSPSRSEDEPPLLPQ